MRVNTEVLGERERERGRERERERSGGGERVWRMRAKTGREHKIGRKLTWTHTQMQLCVYVHTRRTKYQHTRVNWWLLSSIFNSGQSSHPVSLPSVLSTHTAAKIYVSTWTICCTLLSLVRYKRESNVTQVNSLSLSHSPAVRWKIFHSSSEKNKKIFLLLINFN